MTTDLQFDATANSNTPLVLENPVTATASKVTRTLHIINGEHYSGAERVQDLLAQRLPEFGVEIAFVCVKPDKFPKRRKYQDAELHELPMRARFDLGVAKQVASIVKRGEFKLIHAHTTRSCMIARAAASLSGVPLVYHVHSPTIFDSTHKWTNRINAWVERLSLTGVTRIVCVSESLAQHMRAEGFTPRKIVVVPNGVPIRSPLKSRETPTNQWVLGTVALFRPRKGTEVLIEALSILRGHGYDVTLRAVGSFETAEYESRIKSLAKTLRVEDAIQWTGFTSNVDEELDKMDVFVLPSLFGEGLPMVVLEAMAAGVPVVGTRVQGIPEVLQNGHGILATPDSATDLSHAIRQLIRGEASWSEVRERAWARQRERYSDVSMARGLAAVYRQFQ